MPRYSYKCVSCGEHFEAFHMMSEVLDECKACGIHGQEYLQKVPSQFSIAEDKKQTKQTAKQRVDEFIKDAKKELETHKSESREEYNS